MRLGWCALICVLWNASSIEGQTRTGEGVDCQSIHVAFASRGPEMPITSQSIVVRGTSSGPAQMGVSVNGVAAILDLSHAGTAADPFPWVATVQPAEPGMVLLRARATVPNCAAYDAVRSVEYAPRLHLVELRAYPSSGAAPLDVELQLDGPPAQLSSKRYEIDWDGDGKFESTTEAMPARTLFERPGIREVRVRITVGEGKTEVTVPVAVESFEIVNRLLQALWSEFTDALEREDIDGALALMLDDATRAKYRGPLRLIQRSLAAFAAEIGTIDAVYIQGGVGYYILTRRIEGETFGYPVYFQRRADGLWRLVQF
jgi:hypothetical protein